MTDPTDDSPDDESCEVLFQSAYAGFPKFAMYGLLLRNQRWLAWPPQKRQRPSGNTTVSVIVPARNEAADIAQCLKSLLAQDYPKLQVIVVNEHSDDDTPRIIDDIAAADSRLIVIHVPPGNLAESQIRV
jgi:cellulose synthase/poly-beta-1,6-N-acetylglucosamine synthase-like glycosyltransferase